MGRARKGGDGVDAGRDGDDVPAGFSPQSLHSTGDIDIHHIQVPKRIPGLQE